MALDSPADPTNPTNGTKTRTAKVDMSTEALPLGASQVPWPCRPSPVCGWGGRKARGMHRPKDRARRLGRERSVNPTLLAAPHIPVLAEA